MVNALLPLLHGLLVVVAIGVAVTATSPRAAVTHQRASSSKNGLDSAQMQAVAAEGDSIHSHPTEEMVGSMGNGGDGKRRRSREEENHHKELCGTTTASRHSSYSRFCALKSGTSTTRNLRGSQTNSHNNNNPSRHQNKKVVESAAKSQNKEGKVKKRFLRWAGDDEREMTHDGSGGGSLDKAHHDKAASTVTTAVGTTVERHLRTSREDAVLVDAAAAASRGKERSDDVPAADETKSARFGHRMGLGQSFRGRRA